jgi:hypothetical protein
MGYSREGSEVWRVDDLRVRDDGFRGEKMKDLRVEWTDGVGLEPIT